MTIILENGKKITASNETLNYLSIIFDEAAYNYESRECFALAELVRNNSKIIFNELDKLGYYDNVKTSN